MFNIIEILKRHLPRFCDVLELSSKKGEDLALLHEYYEVVASERDKIKTRFLKDKFIDIRVILLDFKILDTHKRFDCIYSRNIFNDFSYDELKYIFSKQKELLENSKYKLVFHIFSKQKEEDIRDILSSLNYEILESNSVDDTSYALAKSLD